jgi:hypothetical protein
MYKSLDDTPLLMVSTLEQLNALLSDLKTAKEVAIDLEVMHLKWKGCTVPLRLIPIAPFKDLYV